MVKSRAVLLKESIDKLLDESLGRFVQHALGKDYKGSPVPFVILTADKGIGFYFNSGAEVNVRPLSSFSNFNKDVANKQAEFRKAKSKKEIYVRQQNNKRKEELKNELRSESRGGYGYFPVKGHYVENADLPENDSVEASFVVIDWENNEPNKFLKRMAYLGAKYDQECIAYKDPDGNYWWYHTIDHVDWEGKQWRKGEMQKIGDTVLLNIKKLEGGFSTIDNRPVTLGYKSKSKKTKNI